MRQGTFRIKPDRDESLHPLRHQPNQLNSDLPSHRKRPFLQPEPQPTPQKQVARVVTTTKEIRFDDNKMARQLLEGIQDRSNQLSQSNILQQTARIDMVQREVDERPTERMQEFPILAETSTSEPTQVKALVFQFMQIPAPTFTRKLEIIITSQRFFSSSKYKMTPRKMMVRRFQLETTTPRGSGGLDRTLDLASSSSGAISEDGASGLETPIPTTRMTWSLTRSTTNEALKGSTPAFMKRPSLTPVKGSSSKRLKK